MKDVVMEKSKENLVSSGEGGHPVQVRESILVSLNEIMSLISASLDFSKAL